LISSLRSLINAIDWYLDVYFMHKQYIVCVYMHWMMSSPSPRPSHSQLCHMVSLIFYSIHAALVGILWVMMDFWS
jgi:hypothetical protein